MRVVLCGEILGDPFGDCVVVAELHGEASATLGHALEGGLVVHHVGERNRRFHDGRAAGHHVGSEYSAAAAREIAGDRPDAVAWRRHLDVDDRLENLWTGFQECVFEGELARGPKRDFLAVDRVGLAVEDGHAHIFDGIAGDDALPHDVANALLDGRHEALRDHAADDLIDEFETSASFERLDAKPDFAELTGASTLLLVPVVTICLPHDRFVIRDLRRLGFHVDALVLDALDH